MTAEFVLFIAIKKLSSGLRLSQALRVNSCPRAVCSFVSDTYENQRLHNKAFHTQRLQLFPSISAADNNAQRYARFVHHVSSSTLYIQVHSSTTVPCVQWRN